jgi:hypothetical protein
MNKEVSLQCQCPPPAPSLKERLQQKQEAYVTLHKELLDQLVQDAIPEITEDILRAAGQGYGGTTFDVQTLDCRRKSKYAKLSRCTTTYVLDQIQEHFKRTENLKVTFDNGACTINWR